MAVQNKAIYAETFHDVRSLINSYLSIDDVVALTYVNPAHKRAVLSSAFASPFWEVLRAKLGHSLEDKDSTPLAERVIIKIFDSERGTLSPSFIANLNTNREKILEKAPNGDYLRPAAVLKATRVLLRWWQACNTMVVWSKIAEERELPSPKWYECQTMGEAVKKASGFSQWISEHNISLRKIAIRGHHLNTLPQEIRQLTSLQELYLAVNWLTSVPAAIGQLSSLEVLDISSNPLTSVPLALMQLTSLKTLSFSNCLLTSVSTTIGQLTSLKRLYLNDNQLTCVPIDIGQLTLLKELYLYNNKLTSLPETIGHLIALRELILKKNLLTSLPESMTELSSLRDLNIENNQIPRESDLIQRLRKVESLKITL